MVRAKLVILYVSSLRTLLLPTEAKAVLFLALSLNFFLFFCVYTITDEPLHSA